MSISLIMFKLPVYKYSFLRFPATLNIHYTHFYSIQAIDIFFHRSICYREKYVEWEQKKTYIIHVNRIMNKRRHVN